MGAAVGKPEERLVVAEPEEQPVKLLAVAEPGGRTPPEDYALAGWDRKRKRRRGRGEQGV